MRLGRDNIIGDVITVDLCYIRKVVTHPKLSKPEIYNEICRGDVDEPSMCPLLLITEQHDDWLDGQPVRTFIVINDADIWHMAIQSWRSDLELDVRVIPSATDRAKVESAIALFISH